MVLLPGEEPDPWRPPWSRAEGSIHHADCSSLRFEQLE